MKVTFIIKKSAKRYDTESTATIYLRLRDGRRLDSVAQTALSINPNLWDEKNECVKSKAVCDPKLRSETNEELRKLKGFIEKEYSRDKDNLDKDWLKAALVRYYNPDKFTPEGEKKQTFEQLFDEFLEKHRLSEVRKKNFKVVKRSLLRYELYVRKVKRNKKDFVLDVNDVTKETLADMWDFFENEYKYFEKYPQIYEDIPEKRTPQPRGKNTLIDCFSRIRTFFLWCYENDKTTNRPFDKFPIEECKYGTPIYITKEERNLVAETDIPAMFEKLDDEDKKACSKLPLRTLETQRDIFVFQCLVGCRVGDLTRLTSLNITQGILEYVPSKTADEDAPVKPRIPLNPCALKLVKKYEGVDKDGRLFPFISPQKYNDAIKAILLICGITRIVQVRNSTTGENEMKRICDVASSHMARRTFVGAAYKAVRDPNIVGKMSGHVEGSRAFNRYRQIDDDILKETISCI